MAWGQKLDNSTNEVVAKNHPQTIRYVYSFVACSWFSSQAPPVGACGIHPQPASVLMIYY